MIYEFRSRYYFCIFWVAHFLRKHAHSSLHIFFLEYFWTWWGMHAAAPAALWAAWDKCTCAGAALLATLSSLNCGFLPRSCCAFAHSTVLSVLGGLLSRLWEAWNGGCPDFSCRLLRPAVQAKCTRGSDENQRVYDMLLFFWKIIRNKK